MVVCLHNIIEEISHQANLWKLKKSKMLKNQDELLENTIKANVIPSGLDQSKFMDSLQVQTLSNDGVNFYPEGDQSNENDFREAEAQYSQSLALLDALLSTHRSLFFNFNRFLAGDDVAQSQLTKKKVNNISIRMFRLLVNYRNIND